MSQEPARASELTKQLTVEFEVLKSSGTLSDDEINESLQAKLRALLAGSGEKTKKPLKVIIAGAPASGKGTQCEVIRERYGLVHLSTGDILRAAVKEGTDLGLKAKDIMEAGQLVPDDLIISVIVERLQQVDCVQNGWLLDGFPRTKAQADALAASGMTADSFLLLNVPEEVLVERVTGRRTDPDTGLIYHLKFKPPPADDELIARLVQRADDTEEKVKLRFSDFTANIDAIKENYAAIISSVNGTLSTKEVSALVTDILDKL